MERDPADIRKAATSLLDRLKSTARATGVDGRSLITRFALERWLHRMIVSGHAVGFVLKGGMVMPLLGAGCRPTEDIDGHFDIPLTIGAITELARAVSACAPAQEDGLVFDTSAMKVEEIRDGCIPGHRVTLRAWLHPAGGNPTEIKVKLDLCYGDAITPGAVPAILPPAVKGLDPVTLDVFPWPTVVAEKIHAISRHGFANSRVKDYYDLLIVSRRQDLDGEMLAEAVSATFRRWGGLPPSAEMPGLTARYAETRARDWAAFLRRGGIVADLPDFGAVVAEVAGFAKPILEASASGASPGGDWVPGEGGWRMHAPTIR